MEVWLSADPNKKVLTIYKHILKFYYLEDSPETIKNYIKNTSKLFCTKCNNNWRTCGRRLDLIEKRHRTWLNNKISLANPVKDFLIKTQDERSTTTRQGRPKKNFEDINRASKKRRVIDLVNSRDAEELQFAAEWASRKSLEKSQKSSKSLTILDALALYVDLDLSYRKYNKLRTVINSVHPDTLPSYYEMTKVRNELLPTKIESTETTSEVDLQQLLDKTARSVVKYAETQEVSFSPSSSLKLYCKWGFDGSSGHSTYKQKFTNANNTDEYLFLTALVPVCLVETDNPENVKWQNKTPSSTYFCRPVKLSFTKETSVLIKEEEQKMANLINNLESTVISLQNDEGAVTVCFEMCFTMVDGSVCSTLSGVSSNQTCYICGATPKLMNLPSVKDLTPNETFYKYGLSPLHNWIRSFECLLHISYRLPLKCWQVRGDSQKQIFNNNKMRIQRQFREKMGLHVDKPKPGFGSSNDGNTARTFFKNSTLSSEITGIDEKLINKMYLINRLLSCGFKININKFTTLLKETNDLYLSLYSWYNMPMSIHKIFVHGPDLIKSLPLPIGQLSEDALEGRHKDARNLRERHTRKSARCHTNHDLIVSMLLTSDPFLSSIRSENSLKIGTIDSSIGEYLEHQNL